MVPIVMIHSSSRNVAAAFASPSVTKVLAVAVAAAATTTKRLATLNRHPRVTTHPLLLRSGSISHELQVPPAAAAAAAAPPPPKAATVVRWNSMSSCPFHTSALRGGSRGGGAEHRRLRDLKRKKEECPFEALGLQRHRNSKELDGGGNGDLAPLTFKEVRATFLKIAMAHHPDTTSAETEEEVEMHRELFIRAREAFEKIVEGPHGTAILKSESPDSADSELHPSAVDLEAWFRQETGHAMPFLDLQTLKEVAEMTETVAHGLDRDGGMWLLAEMVSDSVKKGAGGGDGTAASLLRLEAGDSSSSASGSLGRRRRKR